MTRKQALAKHLDCELEEISEDHCEENRFTAHRCDYYILTHDEATAMATEQIKQTLWAFNAEFIAAHCKRGLSDDAIKAVRKAQESLCEGANDLIESLIHDMDHFIEDAIRSDGIGHFIASYDGNEHQVGEYLIYQLN
jgi:hypothetical protein